MRHQIHYIRCDHVGSGETTRCPAEVHAPHATYSCRRAKKAGWLLNYRHKGERIDVCPVHRVLYPEPVPYVEVDDTQEDATKTLGWAEARTASLGYDNPGTSHLLIDQRTAVCGVVATFTGLSETPETTPCKRCSRLGRKG